MLTTPAHYFDQLYPLQDLSLRLIADLDTGFYLTGGTALSRAYLNHRFSDDLDLFVNFDKRFTLWSNLVIQSFAVDRRWQTLVTKNEEYFARIVLTHNGVDLKIELINDVPSHIGEIQQHPILGRVDSPENILALISGSGAHFMMARWLTRRDPSARNSPLHSPNPGIVWHQARAADSGQILPHSRAWNGP